MITSRDELTVLCFRFITLPWQQQSLSISELFGIHWNSQATRSTNAHRCWRWKLEFGTWLYEFLAKKKGSLKKYKVFRKKLCGKCSIDYPPVMHLTYILSYQTHRKSLGRLGTFFRKLLRNSSAGLQTGGKTDTPVHKKFPAVLNMENLRFASGALVDSWSMSNLAHIGAPARNIFMSNLVADFLCSNAARCFQFFDGMPLELIEWRLGLAQQWRKLQRMRSEQYR